MMKLTDITSLRLRSHQLENTSFHQPHELVKWMGAIQAQDYSMSKWAIGIRVPGTTDASIEKEISEGKIIRTHILRPTWHLVSPHDIRWMLELSAPKIKAHSKSRDKELELTEKIYTKSNTLLEKILAHHHHLTRDEIIEELARHKMTVDAARATHLMVRAEVEGIVCSGPLKGKKHTYALIDERVKPSKKITREEALAKLAFIYFSSHAPATLKDFSWWSGLSVGDARKGLEAVKSKLVEEKIADESYWLPNDYNMHPAKKSSAHFLPAFDEFIISYKDRTAALALEHQPTAFTTNGIFRPVILVDGQAVGIWSRSIKKDTATIETVFFKSVPKSTRSVLEKEAKAYGEFLTKKTEVVYL